MKITKEIRSQIARESAFKSVQIRKKKHGKDYNKVMKEMALKSVEARNARNEAKNKV